MGKNDNQLLLRHFLETKDYEGCQFLDFDVALENVHDGNPDCFALYHLDNLYSNIFKKITPVNEERSLFRFTSLVANGERWECDNCYAFNDIKNGRLTFAAPSHFNDPMDPLIKAWAEWRRIHHGGRDDKRLYGLINETLSKIRICCLVDPLRYKVKKKSLNADVLQCSPLMWAHYADNHKGICIQYKVKPSNIVDDNKIIVRLFDVDYDKPFPLDGDIPFVDSLRVKGDFWRYEKETRLILYSRDKVGDYCSLGGYEIEAVYMGCRIEPDRRNYLKGLLKGTGIKLYQMSFSENSITQLLAHPIA